MGVLECKEIDKQIHALVYCPSTVQLKIKVKDGREEIFNLMTKCATGIKCLVIAWHPS